MRKVAWLLSLSLVVACGEEEEAVNCGLDLTCTETEFCLGIIPPGGTTGDEEYTCEPLPEGCDSLAGMCTDSPPCIEDWAVEYCPDGFTSDSCDGTEAICFQ